MAFGFSSKYVQDYSLGDFSKEQFLVLAVEAAHQLNWNIILLSENGLIAQTKPRGSYYKLKVRIRIKNGIANIRSECVDYVDNDSGRNKRNVTAFLSKLEKIKGSLTQEEIETKLTELRKHYVPKDQDILANPGIAIRKKISKFFDSIKEIFLIFFTPTKIKGYFVAPILININILVFIVMSISGVDVFDPDSEDLLNWGANFRPLILEGEWWRLFTACFIHIGIVHLVQNTFGLVWGGILLEPFFGKVRFLATYLISGIAANVVSFYWNDYTIAAGASCAILGLFGAFPALLTTNLVDKSAKKPALKGIALLIAFNLLYGLAKNSSIDNAAHIGGLVAGTITGFAFIPSLKYAQNKIIMFSTIAILSIALLIFSFKTYESIPQDTLIYYQKMEEVFSKSPEVTNILNLPNTKKMPEEAEKVVNLLTTLVSIDRWRQCVQIIDSLKNLNIPSYLHERNKKLKEYYELKIKSHELRYKAIEENTDLYQIEINEYDRKIDSLVSELRRK